MEIPIKGILTRKDYLHAIKLSRGRLSSSGEMGMSINPWSLFLPIGTGLIILGLWQGAGSEGGMQTFWIVIFVLGCGLVALGVNRLAEPSRQWKQFKPLYAQREGQVTEETVRIHTLVDETHLRWEKFLGYGEYKGVIVLFSCDVHYVPFSRRLFETEADWKTFRALVARKLEMSHRVRLLRDYLKWTFVFLFAALAAVLTQVLLDALTDTPTVGYVPIDMFEDPMRWREITSTVGKTDMTFLGMTIFLTGGMAFITIPVLIYTRDPATIRSWFTEPAETGRVIARRKGVQHQVQRLQRLGFTPLGVKIDNFPLWADKAKKLMLVSQEADAFASISLNGITSGMIYFFTPFLDGGFVLTASRSWFPDAEQDGVSVKTVPLDDLRGLLHAHEQRLAAFKANRRLPKVAATEESSLEGDWLFYHSAYCRRWFKQRLRQWGSMTAACFIMLLIALANLIIKVGSR